MFIFFLLLTSPDYGQCNNSSQGKKHSREPKPYIAAVAGLWAGNVLCPAATAAGSACAAIPAGNNRHKIVFLNEVLEHSRKFSAGSGAFRVKYLPFAAHYAAANCPLHSFLRPRGQIPGVCKAGQVAAGGCVIALKLRIVVENHGKLFTGHRIARTKQVIAISLHNAVLLYPKNCVIVPICTRTVWHIGKRVGILHGGASCHAIENRCNLCAGGCVVRGECGCAGAVHQVILVNEHNSFIEPIVRVNIGKRIIYAGIRVILCKYRFDGVFLLHVLKGVACDCADTLSIYKHIGNVIAAVRGNGKGFVRIFPDADAAGRRDRAARSCAGGNGVVVIAGTAATAVITPSCRNGRIGCGHGKGGACAGSVGKAAV